MFPFNENLIDKYAKECIDTIDTIKVHEQSVLPPSCATQSGVGFTIQDGDRNSEEWQSNFLENLKKANQAIARETKEIWQLSTVIGFDAATQKSNISIQYYTVGSTPGPSS